MQASAALRLTPFAPYHWLMYARSMWFDIEHVQETVGERAGRPTRCSPELTGSWPTGRVGAAGSTSPRRRTARSGALRRGLTGSCRRSADDPGRTQGGQESHDLAGRRAPGGTGLRPRWPRRRGRCRPQTLYLNPARLIAAPYVRRPAVRRLGAPPSPTCGRRDRGSGWATPSPARLGGPPALDRDAHVPRRRRRAVAGRRRGLGVLASPGAAIVYRCPRTSCPTCRTSAMLLPWAGLGWLVGMTIGAALRAVKRRGARRPRRRQHRRRQWHVRS